MDNDTQPIAGNTDTADETPADVSESSPEAERLRTENESLKMSLRIAAARATILKALQAAGARSPELLFDAAKPALQFTDDGELANSNAVLDHLQKSFPEQFGSTDAAHMSIDGAAGQSSRSSYLSKESLRQMKPEQIARLDWNDVKHVLRNG